MALVGLFLMVLIFIMALGADNWFINLPLGREPKPLIARTPYDKIFFGPSGAFPSIKYWMGTDLNGRDQFSRIVYGARVSLMVAILSQVIAVGIGIPLGAMAGWRGGWVDYLVMRLVDVMSAVPTLLFAFLIMARLGAGFWNVMLAIGITSWLALCRLTRAQFLSLRKKEYIEAAVVSGANTRRIVVRHLLPNSLCPVDCGVDAGDPGRHLRRSLPQLPGRRHQSADAELGADAGPRWGREHRLLLASRALSGGDGCDYDAGVHPRRGRLAGCSRSKVSRSEVIRRGNESCLWRGRAARKIQLRRTSPHGLADS